MSDDITGLPPVKPWEERRDSLPHLAGGANHYLDTLAWILRQCQHGLDKAALVEQYRGQFELSGSTASTCITDLAGCGFLQTSMGICRPTDSASRWLATDRAEIAIGTLHAKVKFVGELLELAREPCSKQFLLQSANDDYGFEWKTPGRLDFRLAWLRSAGFVQRLAASRYQTTNVGVAFLERVELYRPATASAPAPVDSPTEFTDGTARDQTREGGELDAIEDRGGEAVAPGTKLSRSAHYVAAEIGDRLESLSRDGAKHQEFEVAVRDAFEFLGFEAEHLSGAGQTDVLLTATEAAGPDGKIPSPRWRYRVTVDAKAASDGRLTSGQVNLPVLEKHRKQHDAQFSLLVGPGPSGQLLKFAAEPERAVGVLDASELSALCKAHASVPLATSAYFALFADGDGKPRGGLVDTSVVQSARDAQVLRQQLPAGVSRAVNAIVSSHRPPDAGVIDFNLSQTNSEQHVAEYLVIETLELLTSPWLSALARVSHEGTSARYVPATASHVVAQRLRRLADAFDDAADHEGGTPEKG